MRKVRHADGGLARLAVGGLARLAVGGLARNASPGVAIVVNHRFSPAAAGAPPQGSTAAAGAPPQGSTAAAGAPPQGGTAAEPPSAGTASRDRRLVESCIAGDPDARIAFDHRFRGLFRHIVDQDARHAPGKAPAERDLIVTEMIDACLRDDAAVLRGFAGRADPETYLVVFARRLAHRIRSRQAAPAAVPATVPAPAVVSVGVPVEQAAMPGPRLGAGPIGRQRRARPRTPEVERIELLLSTLEPAEARLVRLHRIDGRSYGEIAQLTGLSLGAIGPALARARARMEAGGQEQDAGERHGADDHGADDHGAGPTSTDGSARSTG